MGARYEWIFINTLRPGDAVIKFDNRYHPTGSKLVSKKKGIIVEQDKTTTIINWIDGVMEYVNDAHYVQMMVECD